MDDFLPHKRCELCGKFAKTTILVWTGGPEPEPDFVAGNCCWTPDMLRRQHA